MSDWLRNRRWSGCRCCVPSSCRGDCSVWLDDLLVTPGHGHRRVLPAASSCLCAVLRGVGRPITMGHTPREEQGPAPSCRPHTPLSPSPTADGVGWDTPHSPSLHPAMACPRGAYVPLSVAAVPDAGRLSPMPNRVAPAPSALSWCCRMLSRHCVISRNEGREVGSICGQERFPIRSVPPQAPQGALHSKGSSLLSR